jgi:hypothetical protein
MAKADFSLPPSERSVYGATVTARASSGETITLARVGMTAVQALREIATVLDALDDDFRIVSISTPNSIERDLFASRIALGGDNVGTLEPSPEKVALAKIGRSELLHSSLGWMTKRNGRPSPVKHRER